MVNYVFEINGVDFSGMVERDSYNTSLTPVFSPTITTMNGVDHFVQVRTRGGLSVRLNPQTADDVARFCGELLKGPVLVRYHCIQRNADVYATMALDNDLTAAYLSRCLHRGLKWVEAESIALREL